MIQQIEVFYFYAQTKQMDYSIYGIQLFHKLFIVICKILGERRVTCEPQVPLRPVSVTKFIQNIR